MTLLTLLIPYNPIIPSAVKPFDRGLQILSKLNAGDTVWYHVRDRDILAIPATNQWTSGTKGLSILNANEVGHKSRNKQPDSSVERHDIHRRISREIPGKCN